MANQGGSGSGFRVGITLFVNADGGLGLFENGLRQNVILLHHLFRAMPDCAEAVLINAGDGELTEDISRFGVDPGQVRRWDDVCDRLDLVIVAGGALHPDTLRRFRDRGGRSVAYKGGNGGVISMEAVTGRPVRRDAERYFDADGYDAVWLTPQHWATYRGWCETLYRCPVVKAPQVWSPLFITQSAGPRFGYRPGASRWRVGLMEPNITVMKTSHMGMLVCEAAFRTDPDRFSAIYVTNGAPHRDDPHFASFARVLRAVGAGRMTLEPRLAGPTFLAEHCDAIVAHQWENGLNYAYWEALFGGYPLVHNSGLMEGLGYRYADFDAQDGARALLDAKDRHDDELGSYRDRSAEAIAAMGPTSAAMVSVHAAFVSAVLEGRPTQERDCRLHRAKDQVADVEPVVGWPDIRPAP